MTARWQAEGLCRVPTYKPYFADKPPHPMTSGAQNRAAKAVCERCPVLTQCGEWIEAQEGKKPASYRFGVVAARTARERAAKAGATDAADEGIDDEDGAA